MRSSAVKRARHLIDGQKHVTALAETSTAVMLEICPECDDAAEAVGEYSSSQSHVGLGSDSPEGDLHKPRAHKIT